MSRQTAIYNSGDIMVVFSYIPEECDYGVRGSPVWYEPTDISVEELYILDVPTDINTLGEDLRENIYLLIDSADFTEE